MTILQNKVKKRCYRQILGDKLIPDQNLSNKFFNYLHSARNILISMHLNPDGDALGSALAMSHYLDSIKIKNHIVCHNLPHEGLRFLPGIEKVKTFCKDEAFDLSVVFDLNSPSRLGNALSYVQSSGRIMIVDHHPVEQLFGDFRIIDSSACATASILTKLFQMHQVNISTDMATCLLTGIVTDTGNFRNANTTSEALESSAYLMEQGADLTQIVSLTTQRPKKGITLLTYALEHIKYSGSDRVAVTNIPYHVFKSTDTEEFHSEGIVNELLSISGVEYAAILKEVSKDYVRVSLRCLNGLDVAKIAAKFGGGGHKQASGCIIEEDLSTATEMIQEEFIKCLELSISKSQ